MAAPPRDDTMLCQGDYACDVQLNNGHVGFQAALSVARSSLPLHPNPLLLTRRMVRHFWTDDAQPAHPQPARPSPADGPLFADRARKAHLRPSPLPQVAAGGRGDVPCLPPGPLSVRARKRPQGTRIGEPPLSLRALRRKASQGVAIPRIAAAVLQNLMAPLESERMPGGIAQPASVAETSTPPRSPRRRRIRAAFSQVTPCCAKGMRLRRTDKQGG